MAENCGRDSECVTVPDVVICCVACGEILHIDRVLLTDAMDTIFSLYKHLQQTFHSQSQSSQTFIRSSLKFRHKQVC